MLILGDTSFLPRYEATPYHIDWQSVAVQMSENLIRQENLRFPKTNSKCSNQIVYLYPLPVDSVGQA